MIMTILIGIILTFLGIGFYRAADTDNGDKINSRLGMLGFLTMMTGAIIVWMVIFKII